MRITAETCGSHELANNSNWTQIFWDETQKGTFPLTVFVGATMNDDGIKLIVLSLSESCIGSKSIKTVNAVLDVLDKGRVCFKRWKITFEKRYPKQEHDIPPERNLTINNCSKAAGTTDTCNQAYVSRRLIFGEVDKRNDNEYVEGHTIMDKPGM